MLQYSSSTGLSPLSLHPPAARAIDRFTSEIRAITLASKRRGAWLVVARQQGYILPSLILYIFNNISALILVERTILPQTNFMFSAMTSRCFDDNKACYFRDTPHCSFSRATFPFLEFYHQCGQTPPIICLVKLMPKFLHA